MILTDKPISRYLESSYYIDWEDARIGQQANELLSEGDELATIKNTYDFVRDRIKHSWDVQDCRVTARASDVLCKGVGICYAKANLFCALLRANHIPAGICYQRLTLGDTMESGFCVHALNAVYLSSLKRWIRLDARGNKAGVHAEFSVEEERLAFQVRPAYEEIDYQEIYAEPLAATMRALAAHDDALVLYLHGLPESL
ncbi:MAG: transglutaminase family protein [Clostridiales bacterium]|nr:transglutaminase family protein [Clostridiales bacterium]